MNELREFDSNILNINEAFDFSKKYFSKYDFSKRCSVIDNSSKLPMDQAPYATSLLSSVDIKESDILNITFKTIITYFENCLKTRLFPDQWKKASVVPIYKKVISN